NSKKRKMADGQRNGLSIQHKILLVGEGDFSFSLSLALKLGSASNMVSTSLDTEWELLQKYNKAGSNLQLLKSMGAQVLHSVDATQLNATAELCGRKFDRIIFNFPHAGFHRGRGEASQWVIVQHKQLVSSFLKCASGMLRPNGQVHVTHKTAQPFCCWNIVELAHRSSLVLVEQVDFRVGDYPGYSNKRGDGDRADESFPVGLCSNFKFAFDPCAETEDCEAHRALRCPHSRKHDDKLAYDLETLKFLLSR
ncbi:unnamed protein product, partial [Linum tenue]